MNIRLHGLTTILSALVVLTAPTAVLAQDNLVTGELITTVNSGTPGKGGEVTFAVTRDITNWNVTSALGNNAVVRTVTLPIVPSAFMVQPDFTLKMNTDLLESAELTSTDPQTVVYRIREDAVWSDGVPITGDDFIYFWKTQNRRDCPECLINGSYGHDFIETLEQDETGKVVTATFSEPFLGWQGLFMFLYPAHLAEKHGDIAESYNNFLSNEVPAWSGGPYMVESFDPGQLVTLVPNPKWYGEKGPYLDKLKFRIITDSTQQLTALENGEVDVIYPQGATQDMVEQAAGLDYLGIDFQMNPSANWYFMGLNSKAGPMSDIALRKAVLTAIDAGDLKAKTADPYLRNWPHMGSVMFLPNQAGYADRRGARGYGTGDVEKAKGILSEAGYKLSGGSLLDPSGKPVSTLRLGFSPGYPAADDMARLITGYIAPLGLKTDLLTGPNATADYLLSGNFDLYLSYFSQQVFPAVKAGQIFLRDAGPNYFGFNDPKIEEIIGKAAAASSIEESAAILSEADELAMDYAALFPIYQLPTALIYKEAILNLRDNPNQLGPAYNTAEWGLAE